MTIGTRNFSNYATLLKRVMMSEFVDKHVRATRDVKYRASLVDAPAVDDAHSLARHFEYHRARRSAPIEPAGE